MRFLLLGVLLLAACTPDPAPPTPDARPVEATALDGTPLYRPTYDSTRTARLVANLAEAERRYAADTTNIDALIWLGRRQAYLGRYQEAVATYTRGLRLAPDDPRLYRHRGHRYITLRRLDDALADFQQAVPLIEGTEDVIEPDGQPNAAGIPRSTLHTNIWYHLGLAYYLQGRFAEAAEAYRTGLAATTNDDIAIAFTDWLYMTLRRLGREDEAAALLLPIHAEMDILENHSYLRRLLLYKGEASPAALLQVEEEADQALALATQGYGVGNWYLYEGQPDSARHVFRQVLETGFWPAFGYLAAAADLQRLD